MNKYLFEIEMEHFYPKYTLKVIHVDKRINRYSNILQDFDLRTKILNEFTPHNPKYDIYPIEETLSITHDDQNSEYYAHVRIDARIGICNSF